MVDMVKVLKNMDIRLNRNPTPLIDLIHQIGFFLHSLLVI